MSEVTVTAVEIDSVDTAAGNPRFHIYTNIENYRNSRYKGAFPIGLPVRITEKICGTHSRVAVLGGEYFAGSHKVSKREFFDGGAVRSIYWGPLTNDMKDLLGYFADYYGPNVVAFGEICSDRLGYRLFDVSVGGVYLDWHVIEYACQRFCIDTVPLLYQGPFSPDIVEALVEALVDGPTTMCPPEHITCKFKGREGVVITPLKEQPSDIMGGRLIAKAISADYLNCRTTDSH
jgi:hypothetical protein